MKKLKHFLALLLFAVSLTSTGQDRLYVHPESCQSQLPILVRENNWTVKELNNDFDNYFDYPTLAHSFSETSIDLYFDMQEFDPQAKITQGIWVDNVKTWKWDRILYRKLGQTTWSIAVDIPAENRARTDFWVTVSLPKGIYELRRSSSVDYYDYCNGGVVKSGVFTSQILRVSFDGFSEFNNTISGNQSVCNGAQPNNVSGSIPSISGIAIEDLSVSYSWTTSPFLGNANTPNYSFTRGLTSTTTLKRKVYINYKDLGAIVEYPYSNTVSISVYPNFDAGTISIEGSNPICYNTNSPVLRANPTGGSGVYTYQWMVFSTGGIWTNISGATNRDYTATNLTSDKKYTVKVSNACGVMDAREEIILVYADVTAGTISGTQTICYNTAPAAFTATAPTGGSGSYSYVWERSTNGTTWTAIAGATSATYTSPALTQTTHFRRKVVNSCKTVTSNTVTVTVYADVTAGTISANQTICYNTAPAAFTATAPTGGDGNYSYVWERSTNGTTWTAIAGATSATYTSPALTQTTHFRRKEVNSCKTVTSNTVTVTVYQDVASATIGDTHSICNGGAPNILSIKTAASGGSGSFTYQWESSTNGTTFTDITSATGTTYQGVNLTASRWFRLKSINTCKTVTSNVVKVTTYAPFSEGAVGASQTICYNTAPSPLGFTTTPSGGDGIFGYQWQVSSDGTNFTNVTGANSSTYAPASLTASRWYRVVVSSSCGSGTTAAVKVTVNPNVTAGALSANQTICHSTAPAPLSFATAPAGGIGTFAMQWEYSADGAGFTPISGATSATYAPASLTASRWYRVKSVNQCGTVTTAAVKVTVNPKVSSGVIGSAQTICFNTAPSALGFTTAPSGGVGAYAYQWQHSTDGSYFSDVSGATSATYAPASLTASRWYRVLVSNQCETVTTNTVKVTVLGNVTSPEISVNQTICYGANPDELTISTLPTGGNGSFTYQWQSSTNGTTFSDIASATGVSYQPVSLTASRWYRVVATTGCGSVTSNAVKVTVMDELKAGVIGSEQTICFNTAPSVLCFTTAPSGGDGSYSYQWAKSLDGSNFTNVAGETSASYEPEALTASTWFRVAVATGCGSVTSNTVKVTVMDETLAPAIGDEQSICYNAIPEAVTIKEEAKGGTGSFTYQWERSIDGATFTPIVGSNGLSYQPVNLTASRWYRVTATNSCKTVTSNVVQVAVGDAVTAGAIAGAQTICYNTTPEAIAFTTEPTGIGSLIWQRSENGSIFTDIEGATELIYQPDALTASTFYRAKYASPCETKYTEAVKVTVLPQISAGSIGSNQSVCSGATPSQLAFTTAPSGGDGSYSYQWQRSLDNVSFVDISSATGVSYQPEVLAVTSYFRAMISTTCGSVTSNTVTVTVYQPLQNGTISENQTVCSGTTPEKLFWSVLPVSSSGFLAFQWERSTDGVQWQPIVGATTAEYQPAAIASDVFFRCTASDGCQTVTSNVVTLSVFPTLSAGIIEGTQTVCYNTAPSALAFATAPSGGVGAFTYQWAASSDGTNFSPINLAIEESYQPQALTASRYYQVTVANGCGAVGSNIVKVTVLPEVSAGSIGGNQSICYGGTPTQVFSATAPLGGNGSFTYQWQVLEGASWVDVDNQTGENYQPEALTASAIYRRLAISSSCDAKPSNVVTINVKPEFVAGSIGNNQTIAYGATPSELVSLTAASGGFGSYAYQWQVSADNVTFSNITYEVGASYQPQALTRTTHFRRVVSDATCGTEVSNTVTITVLSDLQAGTISDNQTICFDATPAIISGTEASGGVGTFSYQWQRSTDNNTFDNIIGATGINYQPLALSQSTYFKRLASIGANTVASNVVFIEVRPALEEPATDARARYCRNAPVTVAVLNPNLNLTYNWYDSQNNRIQQGSTFSVPSLTANVSVSVEKVDANGCTSPRRFVSIAIDEVSADFSASSLVLKQGEKVSFSNLSAGGDTYLWNFGDGVTSSDIAPAYYYHKLVNLEPTRFTVSLTATSQYGCSSSLVKENYILVEPVTTGIGDAKRTFTVPSLISDRFTVQAEGKFTVWVFSSIGNLIATQEGYDSVSIEANGIPDGLYILKVKQYGKTFTFKVVKNQ